MRAPILHFCDPIRILQLQASILLFVFFLKVSNLTINFFYLFFQPWGVPPLMPAQYPWGNAPPSFIPPPPGSAPPPPPGPPPPPSASLLPQGLLAQPPPPPPSFD